MNAKRSTGHVAKDADFAKLLSQTMEIAELMGRNVAVGIDL
jgi:hypothetical protein